MSDSNALLDAFDASFDDGVLTRSERKALKMLIDDARLDTRQQGVLRAKIFDIAREHLSAWPSEQVLDWLEKSNKLLLPKTHELESNSRVYFSPGDDCLNAIKAQIRAARKRMDICVFTITDNRISDHLMERHRNGFNIRIITDNDKAWDAGSDIKRMADAGIDVRVDTTPNHMHHKFAVVDEATVLTGSYNWTRSAAEHNHENLVISEDPNLAKRFSHKFEELWEVMAEF